jgi:SNF2 family DNA or RNA helicase
MGLGKTIQIIALMVTNSRGSRHDSAQGQDSEEEDGEAEPTGNVKAKSKAKAGQTQPKKAGWSKTTLIVAPASLLRQVRNCHVLSF